MRCARRLVKNGSGLTVVSRASALLEQVPTPPFFATLQKVGFLSKRPPLPQTHDVQCTVASVVLLAVEQQRQRNGRVGFCALVW